MASKNLPQVEWQLISSVSSKPFAAGRSALKFSGPPLASRFSRNRCRFWELPMNPSETLEILFDGPRR